MWAARAWHPKRPQGANVQMGALTLLIRSCVVKGASPDTGLELTLQPDYLCLHPCYEPQGCGCQSVSAKVKRGLGDQAICGRTL
jgi:hypothetical protein